MNCRVCGRPLDPVLPAGGYTTHPCCDPREKPAAATAARPVTDVPLPGTGEGEG